MARPETQKQRAPSVNIQILTIISRRCGQIFKLVTECGGISFCKNVRGWRKSTLKGNKDGRTNAKRILIIILERQLHSQLAKQNHEETCPSPPHRALIPSTQSLKPYGKKSAKISLKIKPSLTHLIWAVPSAPTGALADRKRGVSNLLKSPGMKMNVTFCVHKWLLQATPFAGTGLFRTLRRDLTWQFFKDLPLAYKYLKIFTKGYVKASLQN